ncbi:MAG: HD domain-containing protein [Deltaproteobacteria bacterium]|nr:HD domain-containing protein [Deltaproteobacteria bacterium]
MSNHKHTPTEAGPEAGPNASPGLEEPSDAVEQAEAARVIVKLNALEQAARIYDMGNDVVRAALEEILSGACTFAEATSEPLELSLFGYSFFANRRLLRMDYATYGKAEQLKCAWDRVGMDGLVLPPTTTLDELREFVRHWVVALSEPEQAPGFLAHDHGGINVRRSRVGRDLGGKLKLEEYLVRAYCALLALVRQMVTAFGQGSMSPTLRIKRLVQVLVDHLEGYRGLLLALVLKPELRGDLASHLLSTAVFALLLGRGLGFERNQLVGLGVAALMHDLPKAGLGNATLNSMEQPAELSSDARSRLALHWVSRLQKLLLAAPVSKDLLARAVVLYESQLEFSAADLYGEKQRSLSLYSRIIRLADRLDTLTLHRQGRGTHPHHHALAAMSQQTKSNTLPQGADLVAVVGIFPEGSVVRLNNGEIAVVLEQSPSGEMAGPIVMIVLGRNGEVDVNGPQVDLSLQTDNGIASVLPLEGLGFNALRCFGLPAAASE